MNAEQAESEAERRWPLEGVTWAQRRGFEAGAEWAYQQALRDAREAVRELTADWSTEDAAALLAAIDALQQGGANRA